MNDHEFRNLVRKNRLRFEWAEKNPAAADKEERAKKLRALVAEKKRARPAISDNESEDEAAPVRPHKRNSQQQIISPEVTLADREAVDDSQLSDLFVGNDDDSSPGSTPSTGPADGDLFVRQSPKVRRPPLAQSESSLSDGEETDDSMMVKLSGRRRRAPQESARARGATDKRRPTRKSTQSPKSLAKRAETAPIPKPVTKPDEGKTPRNESRRPSQPQAVTATRNQQEKSSAQKSATSKSPVRTTAAAQRKTSTSIGDRSAAAAAPAVASVATAASSSSAIPSSGSIGQGTARRTAPGPGANGGIRLVNQPQTQQRTPWQNSDRLYTNLRSRGNADKRSRTEAAPDLSVLQIVNNVPAPVQSRSQAPRGDAYARRELGTRRVQEEDTVGPARRVLDDPYGRREIGTRRYQDEDMDDTSRRGSADGIVPLQPWETNKVPLVCSAWRLSNNCPRTAQQCRFMHRNKDANGDDYEVADVNGVVPPKYRNPALTCLFWLNNPNGCKKPAKQCNYAHRNTGHIPYSDPSAVGQHVKLDLTTEKESAKPDSAKPRDKRMMRPSELTCWYWTKERCRHSAENCQFQHYDTGTIADPPPSARWKHNANTDNVAGGNGRVARRASQPSARMESLHLSTYVRPVEADVSEEAQPRFFDDLIEHAPQQSVQPPRPPPPPPIEFPPAKASCEQLQTKIKTALKLEYNDIFARNGGVMDGRALLIYEPDQHAEELETITRWLLMHHVRVFSMHSTGAWDRFRQEIMEGGSGVVIVSCTHCRNVSWLLTMLGAPGFRQFHEDPGIRSGTSQAYVSLVFGLSAGQMVVRTDPSIPTCYGTRLYRNLPSTWGIHLHH
jgi:chromo domain-containing protein 1